VADDDHSLMDIAETPLLAERIVADILRKNVSIGDLLYPAEVRRTSNGAGASVMVTVRNMVIVAEWREGQCASKHLFRFRIGVHRHAESREDAKADKGEGTTCGVCSHEPFLSQTR
jgi:hypothetical protein